jgi:hypothetical protein
MSRVWCPEFGTPIFRAEGVPGEFQDTDGLSGLRSGFRTTPPGRNMGVPDWRVPDWRVPDWRGAPLGNALHGYNLLIFKDLLIRKNT